MQSPAPTKTTNLTGPSWRALVGLILLAAAFIYVWILPLFRPRGDFLWGHYRLKDVYLGIPIGLATLCVLLMMVVPSRYRRSLSLRLVTLSIAILGAFFVCDATYALGVMGAWREDFWLDQAQISRRYSVADGELGFVRKPGVTWRGYVPEANKTIEYRTDENGFRNPPGMRKADIVFIGDSFTESGTMVEEDTFVRRVEKASGLRAVNLGRGAYGPQQELIVLQRYGLAFEPQVVVWQLFEGNDLDDAASFAEWKQSHQPMHTSLRERYFNNSFLAEWLKRTRVSDTGQLVTLRSQQGAARRISIRYPYDPGQPAKIPHATQETLRAVEAGYRLCQSRGIQLLVVVVPTMVRVMEPDISFDRDEDRRRYLPDAIPGQKDFSGRIEELCTQIGCSFVDSFGAMRQAIATGNRNPYIPNDEHLDISGHEVMTKVIIDWMQSRRRD